MTNTTIEEDILEGMAKELGMTLDKGLPRTYLDYLELSDKADKAYLAHPTMINLSVIRHLETSRFATEKRQGEDSDFYLDYKIKNAHKK